MTQFCIDCSAELRANVKFCTKCGATTHSDAVSAEQSVETQTEVPVSFFKRDLPHLLGAVAILVILVVGGTYFFGQPIIETDGCDPASAAAGADCAIAAEPDITGQKVQMFIVADANMRDRATAKGSNIIDKIMRGATVSGVLQLGEDGQSRWLKLDGGDGFIGAVNLSIAAPPNLAKSFVDMKWNVEVSTDLLAAPIDGSAVVGRLNMNDQVTIAGVTENGYVETKRNKGGVGYFLATPANDRTGALVLNNAHMDSDIVNDSPASVAESEKNAVPFLTRGISSLAYDGQIGDQIITLFIETNATRKLLFITADYQNVGTKKKCSSMLVFKRFNADQTLDFKQGVTKNGISCGQFPDVNLSVLASNSYQYPSPEISLRWTMNGKTVMEGDLQQLHLH